MGSRKLFAAELPRWLMLEGAEDDGPTGKRAFDKMVKEGQDNR